VYLVVCLLYPGPAEHMANAAMSCNHLKYWKILLSVSLISKLHKLVLTQLRTITYIYIYVGPVAQSV